MKKCKRDDTDQQMALLEWRNTPDINRLGPVQKFMSRRTKTTMPTAEALLKPLTAEGVDDNIKHRRQLTKCHYDQHTKPLPELDIGDSHSFSLKWSNYQFCVSYLPNHHETYAQAVLLCVSCRVWVRPRK